MENTLVLRNGRTLPLLGFGVYLIKEQGQMTQAIRAAWDAGYRSFDTAQMYENEELLGRAFQANGIKREEYFLTTKIHMDHMSPEKVRTSLEESLAKLGTSYADALLVHWPGQKKERLIACWKTFMELYEEGTIRAFGGSNFEIYHMEWLKEAGLPLPMILQIERHPFHTEEKLTAYAQENGIAVEAWSPLMRGKLQEPLFAALAEKYGKTPAQIVLRWNVQQQVAVIPKSSNPGRIAENSNIFDFELAEEDMAAISACNQDLGSSWDPKTFDY